VRERFGFADPDDDFYPAPREVDLREVAPTGTHPAR